MHIVVHSLQIQSAKSKDDLEVVESMDVTVNVLERCGITTKLKVNNQQSCSDL